MSRSSDQHLIAMNAEPFENSQFGLCEELGDYRPGCGIVGKLLEKFSALGASDPSPGLFHIKQFIHVDVAEENRHDHDVGCRNRPAVCQADPSHHNSIHGTCNLSMKTLHRSTSIDAVLADDHLARNDIVLIEKYSIPKSEVLDSHLNDTNSMPIYFSSLADDDSIDELPKPNTVFRVRSFFEAGIQNAMGDMGTVTSQNKSFLNHLYPNCKSPCITTNTSVSNKNEIFELSQSVDKCIDDASTSRNRDDSGIIKQAHSMNNNLSEIVACSQTEIPVSTVNVINLTDKKINVTCSRPDYSFKSEEGASSMHVMSTCSEECSFESMIVHSSNASSKCTAVTLQNTCEGDVTFSGKKELSCLAVSVKDAAILPPSTMTDCFCPGSSSVPHSSTPSTKKISIIMPVAPFKESRIQDDICAENSCLSSNVRDEPSDDTDFNTSSMQGSKKIKKMAHSKGRAPLVPVRKSINISVACGVVSEQDLYSDHIVEQSFSDFESTQREVDGPSHIEMLSISHNPVNTMPVAPFKESRIQDNISAEIFCVSSNVRDELSDDNNFNTSSKHGSRKLKKIAHSKGRAPSVPVHKSINISVASGVVSEQDSYPDHIVEQNFSDFESAQMEYDGPTHIETLNISQNPVNAEDRSASMDKTVHVEPMKGMLSITNCVVSNASLNGEDVSLSSHHCSKDHLGRIISRDELLEEFIFVDGERRLAFVRENQQAEINRPSSTPNVVLNEITLARQSMRDSVKRRGSGVSEVFDSSQLKRKVDYSQAKPESNLICDDAYKNNVISEKSEPCSVDFVGENASIGRSMLLKSRKIKVGVYLNY